MQHKCPICGKPTDSEKDADFPFCSERCRITDLGNWAAEKYKVSRPMDESELDELDDTQTNRAKSNGNGDSEKVQ